MITLTRLNGFAFALNPDLIERVEQTPDTVVTLVDGTKYLVRESLELVVEIVRDFRASVIAAAAVLDVAETQATRQARLASVPQREEAPAPVLSLPKQET